MLFPRVNREDAEKIFTVIHNVSGSSITTGMGARYVGAAAAENVSADGISAVKLDADGNMAQFAGIAKRDIPDDDFGIVQLWGAVDSIHLSAEANKTIAALAIASSFLKKGAVAGTFTSTLTPQALSTMAGKFVQVWNTTNISGGLNYAKGFVRAF